MMTTTNTALLTTTLRDGTIALAKSYHGEPVAKTFANRTQAFNACDKAGPGWQVERRGRPFFVVKVG